MLLTFSKKTDTIGLWIGQPVLNGKGAIAVVEGGEIIDDDIRGKALALYGDVAGLAMRGLEQHEVAFSIV